MLDLRLDPDRPNHVTILGRKGSGKSVLASLFWDQYPHDRIVIDPTGDVDAGDGAQELTTPLPARWPLNPSESRSTLRYAADPGSATYLDDLDRCVGIAFSKPGKKLLWVDEVGEVTSANRKPPYMRRALHQGRHRDLSMLLCGPRPIDVDPLVISQADYLACFEMPNPKDRERVADNIGLPPAEFDAAQAELVDHGFCWWDTRQRELTICPPLPHHLAAKAARATSRSKR